MITIPMSVQADLVAVPMAVSAGDPLIGMEIATAVEIVQPNPYTGQYRVTPGAEAITLPTADRYLAEDVVIDPVPQNYGLITWNGSTLTVS